MRILAALAALVLLLVPLGTAPAPAVAALGLPGLALAAAGILGPWPQLAAAAGAMFVASYAAAVRSAASPAGLLGAAAFGLALLLLLQSADLAHRARGATVDPGLARFQIGAWLGLGGGTFGATMLGTAMASVLAESVPHAAAPLLTAAAALGVLVALAAIMKWR